LIKLKMSEKG